MSTTQAPNAGDPILSRPRRIGVAGTWARVIVGAGLVALAGWIGLRWSDIVIGLGAIPTVVTFTMWLRARAAAPLRLDGAGGHCLAWAIGVGLFVALPRAAMLFYGSSMLLVAARGVGGCEPFALSNLLLRRDDQLSCPLFGPIDALEARHRAESGP